MRKVAALRHMVSLLETSSNEADMPQFSMYSGSNPANFVRPG